MTDTIAVVEKRENETPAPAPPQTRTGEIIGSIGAVVVWGLIIGAIVAPIMFSRGADVLLDVVNENGLMVSGTVLFHGSVVDNGRVHVVVTNAKNKQYLASAVLPLEHGSFKTAQAILPELPADQPLRIGAEYTGATSDGEGATTAVSGSATAFVNSSPPLNGRTTAGIVSSLALLLVCLIVLFTGELTSLRARTMFAATYFMTFLSLALPIAVTVLVSQNSYLVDIMSDAPIGLVRGTAEGVAEPQWLLNIGGAVIRKPRAVETMSQPALAASSANAAATVLAAELSAPPTSSATTSGATQLSSTGEGGSAAVPDRQFDARAAASTSFVVGGLTVPFYIVMLAMLGAGINMTRQVPAVQMEYDRQITPERQSFFMALFHAPMTVFQQERVVKTSERAAAALIRNRLIDSYMYLLAAPFLAIAVYYLLQVVATNTATPVLVLMSFSTGLISDSIVKRITKFAQETIGNGDKPAVESEDDEKPQVTTTSSVVQSSAGPTEAAPVKIPAVLTQLAVPPNGSSGSASNGGGADHGTAPNPPDPRNV